MDKRVSNDMVATFGRYNPPHKGHLRTMDFASKSLKMLALTSASMRPVPTTPRRTPGLQHEGGSTQEDVPPALREVGH